MALLGLIGVSAEIAVYAATYNLRYRDPELLSFRAELFILRIGKRDEALLYSYLCTKVNPLDVTRQLPIALFLRRSLWRRFGGSVGGWTFFKSSSRSCSLRRPRVLCRAR